MTRACQDGSRQHLAPQGNGDDSAQPKSSSHRVAGRRFLLEKRPLMAMEAFRYIGASRDVRTFCVSRWLRHCRHLTLATEHENSVYFRTTMNLGLFEMDIIMYVGKAHVHAHDGESCSVQPSHHSSILILDRVEYSSRPPNHLPMLPKAQNNA